jgi:hypothetical protein
LVVLVDAIAVAGPDVFPAARVAPNAETAPSAPSIE